MCRIPPKVLALALSIVALISIVLTGCGGNTPAATTSTATSPVATNSSPTPTLTTEDIVNKSLAALTKLTSYQFDVNMTLKASGTINDQKQDANIAATGNGAHDVANKKMQNTLDIEIESSSQGNLSIPVEMYLVDGWHYAKISLPATGEQWVKSKVNTDSFEAKDQMEQALVFLKSAIKVTVAGTEDVDGAACYVLQIEPDLAMLSEWIKSFQGMANGQDQRLANLDLAKFVKNLSIKEWVTKDAFILKKSDIIASVSLNGADIGDPAKASDNLALDMTQTLKLTGQNQPVSIVLPPEAQNAREVTIPQIGKTPSTP